MVLCNAMNVFSSESDIDDCPEACAIKLGGSHVQELKSKSILWTKP